MIFNTTIVKELWLPGLVTLCASGGIAGWTHHPIAWAVYGLLLAAWLIAPWVVKTRIHLPRIEILIRRRHTPNEVLSTYFYTHTLEEIYADYRRITKTNPQIDALWEAAAANTSRKGSTRCMRQSSSG